MLAAARILPPPLPAAVSPILPTVKVVPVASTTGKPALPPRRLSKSPLLGAPPPFDFRGWGETANRQCAIRSHERHTQPRTERQNPMATNSTFGDLVYSYTRKDAINDGVLVNLSKFPVTRAYWSRNLCCTAIVWAIIEEANKTGSDLDGVLHDIYWIAKTAISRGNREDDSASFRVAIGNRDFDLRLHIGPGDHAEPVLTLMLPHED